MAKLSYTCPFCFEHIKSNEIEYRCHNGWCPGKEEEDEKYSEYIGAGAALKLGHVVQSQTRRISLGVPKPVMCDKCGQPTLRICPHCHNTLPDSTVLGSDNIISIIGTRSAGKSLYITVLINELMTRIAPSFDASMQGFVDMSGLYDANKLYRDTKYSRLYDKQKTLPQTMMNQRMRGAGDQDKTPLVYRFAYVQNQLGRKDDFTLAFFDSAGEDQQDAHMAATVMRYIAHSKGVIFLLDPLQIPEVLEQVESVTGKKSTSTGTDGGVNVAPNVVLANITALIRQSLGLEGKRKKIGIPVAVAFSKFDAVQPIIPSQLTLQQTSPHCDSRAFVRSDAQNVDAEMRSLLQSWGQQSLLTQIDLDYKNFAFFALSSLGFGNEPDSDQKIKRPAPHRVEDPLLWLMSENNLLSTADDGSSPLSALRR